MQRDQWALKLAKFGWLCGHCQEGRLHPEKETLNERHTAATAIVATEEWFEPEMAEFRFSALLRCDNADCSDYVAVSGTSRHEYHQIGPDEYVDTPTFLVQSVTPSPLPFAMDGRVPQTVAKLLRSACGLIWNDHDAAGNKVRQAIEALLDERKQPKRGLTLHTRIERYKAKNTDAANHLMAIKWIGNAGSHTGKGLSRDQVLDALEILEVVLNDVYVRDRARISANVTKILASKRPLPPPKKTKKRQKAP